MGCVGGGGNRCKGLIAQGEAFQSPRRGRLVGGLGHGGERSAVAVHDQIHVGRVVLQARGEEEVVRAIPGELAVVEGRAGKAAFRGQDQVALAEVVTVGGTHADATGQVGDAIAGAAGGSHVDPVGVAGRVDFHVVGGGGRQNQVAAHADHADGVARLDLPGAGQIAVDLPVAAHAAVVVDRDVAAHLDAAVHGAARGGAAGQIDVAADLRRCVRVVAEVEGGVAGVQIQADVGAAGEGCRGAIEQSGAVDAGGAVGSGPQVDRRILRAQATAYGEIAGQVRRRAVQRHVAGGAGGRLRAHAQQGGIAALDVADGGVAGELDDGRCIRVADGRQRAADAGAVGDHGSACIRGAGADHHVAGDVAADGLAGRVELSRHQIGPMGAEGGDPVVASLEVHRPELIGHFVSGGSRVVPGVDLGAVQVVLDLVLFRQQAHVDGVPAVVAQDILGLGGQVHPPGGRIGGGVPDLQAARAVLVGEAHDREDGLAVDILAVGNRFFRHGRAPHAGAHVIGRGAALPCRIHP
ncbi:hypothetical protein D9M68_465820 [compost metagenome]